MTKKNAQTTNALVINDEADLDRALQSIEAQHQANEAQAGSNVIIGDAPVVDLTDIPADENATFTEAYDAIALDDRIAFAKQLGAAVDQRIARVQTEQPNNLSQPAKLNGYRNKLTQPQRAAALMVTGTDPQFVNRAGPGSTFFNIYAIDKVNDVVEALITGVMRNAINKAILKTMFNFDREGKSFTGEYAAAAVSDKIRITDPAIKKLMVQHTVSPSTVSTQKSSSMEAFQVLGLVKNTGSVKFPVYQLTDAPAVTRLRDLLAA